MSGATLPDPLEHPEHATEVGPERVGCNPRRSGTRWAAKCPGHEDHNPSLTTAEGPDGLDEQKAERER